MNVIWMVILALVFLAGAAFPVVFPYVAGAMPSYVRQPVGDVWMWISLLGQGQSEVRQQANGRYVIDPLDEEDVTDERNMRRFKGVLTALTYDRCKEAFGRNLAKHAHDKLAVGKKVGQRFRRLEETRGGNNQIGPNPESEDSLLVRLDQFLEQYQYASVDEGRVDVEQVSLTEHGGDTGGATNKMRFIGVFAMSVLGMLFGYVMFVGF